MTRGIASGRKRQTVSPALRHIGAPSSISYPLADFFALLATNFRPFRTKNCTASKLPL